MDCNPFRAFKMFQEKTFCMKNDFDYSNLQKVTKKLLKIRKKFRKK
jgi:hypothetical protein